MADVPAITCPACKKRFRGKPGLEGKKIKCPACAEAFVVPAAAAVAVGASAPPPSTPAAPADASNPQLDDDNYKMEFLDTSAKCPNCAKPMASEDAIICIHCGYNTLTRVHGETKKLVQITLEEHLRYLLPSIIAASAFFAILLFLLFFNITVPDLLTDSTRWGWVGTEGTRWPLTTLLLFLLWPIGNYAFNTLALRPRPPDVLKEDVPE